jgi:hypothetical protein|nr:MAG TPA: hypothetical protein [Caudoviricetes sp.]
MKVKVAIIIAVIIAFISAGVGIWYFTPKAPKADIVSITDLHQLKNDEDWEGKIIRWEVVQNTLDGLDEDSGKYGILCKVKVKGSPGDTYGQFNMYDVPEQPSIRKGDVLYVQVTELEDNAAFGAMVKGDILYIEKGKR